VDSAWPGLAPSARLPVSAAPRPRKERRRSGAGAPAGPESKDMLRKRSGRTFSFPSRLAAASFIAFLQPIGIS